MSNFTPLVKYEIEFEGDTITMDMKRLKRKDYIKFLPYLADADGLDVNEDGEYVINKKFKFENQLKLMDEVADLFPKYVDNFKGLKDKDGNHIPLKDMINEVYFFEVISDMFMKLFEISSPDNNELVKLKSVPEG